MKMEKTNKQNHHNNKNQTENVKYSQNLFVVHVHIRTTSTRQERQRLHDSHCFHRRRGAADGNQNHLGCFWDTAPQYEVSHGRGLMSVFQTGSEVQSGAEGGSARAAWHPRRVPAPPIPPLPGKQLLWGAFPRHNPTGDQRHFPDPCLPSGSGAGWFTWGLWSCHG